MSNKLQEHFFGKTVHQYPSKLILKPPYHTVLETTQIIAWLKHKITGRAVIDFGCGSGRLTIPLLQQNFRVTAIDISRNSLNRLRQTAEALGLARRLKTRRSLNNNQKAYAVVGADILHHINQEYYLKRLHRVLRPNGVVAFSEPNYWHVFWHVYLRFFSNWQVEAGIKQCTYFKLQQALQQAGFHKVKIVGYGLLPLPLFNWSEKLYQLNIKFSRMPILKYLSYRFFIFAQK